GSVWRRSTMPATDCRAARTWSWGAFRTIMYVLYSSSSIFPGAGPDAGALSARLFSVEMLIP
ncbi:hypothetical protein, partial [uncultured Pseudacidovorax sp.]|uniref:hypothetical protein n=1 Tax=uncultured Pseudacidovorax sp. TaxID=679313 RepID=UPI0025D82C55